MKYLPHCLAFLVCSSFFVFCLTKPLPEANAKEIYFETQTDTSVCEEPEIESFTIVEHIHTVDETTVCETEKETECETEPVTMFEWEPYKFISISNYTQREIKSVCDRYEISYDLIIAICMQESSLNPNCIGDGGKAFGLGQIREEFWDAAALSLGLYEWRTDAVQNAEMVCYIITGFLSDGTTMLQEALNLYRHGYKYEITEPDGITYSQHIYNNLNWIESQKEGN